MIMMMNYVKGWIYKTQQNSKCKLCGDRNETMNHIISECSKLAQKEYKTRHEWVGKVIHWKLCKKFIFDHTNKWYMPNPESVLENKTHKILWDFDMPTDQLISARRPDIVIAKKINKKTKNKKTKTNKKQKENLPNCRHCRSVWPQSKTERKKKNKKTKQKKNKNNTWTLPENWKKTMERESGGDTNCNWFALYSHQKICTRTGRVGNKRTSGDHPNYNLFKTVQKTEKSLGDFMRLAVT